MSIIKKLTVVYLVVILVLPLNAFVPSGSGFSVGGGIGGGVSGNFGLNNSSGYTDMAWVNNQTSIIGTNSVNIEADKTHIAGAVIANVTDSDQAMLTSFHEGVAHQGIEVGMFKGQDGVVLRGSQRAVEETGKSSGIHEQIAFYMEIRLQERLATFRRK
ncbi:hypothetical protein [Elusimicrobium minutum]|uniref:hypothetical protein n=1 Tax=Elusimicrobium minutum TaxID=423605 RepID=UPI0001617EB4|nr:hypothetical protein [Elusimicrobium minutum]